MNFLQYRRHGGVAGRRDKLYLDLRAVVADADELLHEIGNATEDEIVLARGRIEQRLQAARTAIEDTRTAVSRNVRHAAAVSQDYARENPWKVFGLPAVAALVVFAVLSRR